MPTPVFFSAVSGRIVITAPTGGELAVGTYTFSRTNSIADIGNSTSGGFEKSKRIRKGGRLQATVFWDSGAIPETLSLDEEFTATLYIGDSGKVYAAVNFVTESCDIVGCSQDNVVTYSLTARTDGTIPDPTTAP